MGGDDDDDDEKNVAIAECVVQKKTAPDVDALPLTPVCDPCEPDLTFPELLPLMFMG